MLPFTTEQFLGVFEQYNQAIWPMQIVAYLLGLTAVVLAIRPVRRADRIISAILSLLWLWNGAVYHLTFFQRINPAAEVFGALFMLQAIVLLLAGTMYRRLTFRVGADRDSIVGGLLIAYAMLIYPLLGELLGHGYPQSPVFGVAPCPTVIFTFGLLLWTRGHIPVYVLAVPFVWSVLGVWAALALGIREDIGLLVAGLVGTALIVVRDWRMPSQRDGGRHRFA